MNADYVVEFEKYYEVVRPIASSFYKNGVCIGSSNFSVGQIVKGKDVVKFWLEVMGNTKVAKAILKVDSDQSYQYHHLRELPHQVFF